MAENANVRWCIFIKISDKISVSTLFTLLKSLIMGYKSIPLNGLKMKIKVVPEIHKSIYS